MRLWTGCRRQAGWRHEGRLAGAYHEYWDMIECAEVFGTTQVCPPWLTWTLKYIEIKKYALEIPEIRLQIEVHTYDTELRDCDLEKIECLKRVTQ